MKSERSLYLRDSYDIFPGGLVVRIRRSHRRGPGSIPGQGMECFLHATYYMPLLTNFNSNGGKSISRQNVRLRMWIHNSYFFGSQHERRCKSFVGRLVTVLCLLHTLPFQIHAFSNFPLLVRFREHLNDNTGAFPFLAIAGGCDTDTTQKWDVWHYRTGYRENKSKPGCVVTPCSRLQR